MTNYTKTTDFASKDTLPSGNANKIVKGTEIDTEFNNIATAVATKADSASPTFTGVISVPDGSASAPSITNTGDTNAGLFFSAADTLAFTAGGTAQFTMADGVIAPVTDNDIDLGTSSLKFKDFYIDGIAYLDAINLNGTAITSTAAEINILDGVTSTAAELNILDGVTSTTAELNILDGVTSTAAEINLLDGVTATTTELNYNDTGASVGTVVASKVVTVDANKDVASFRNITLTGELDAGSLDISGDADIDGTLETDALSINGTAVTSTAAELNILDGKAFLDEDNMASNSATGIASQQSIKAYVDSQVTAQDLDFQADSGGALSIDLDSETLTFTGGTGIDTSGSGNAVTFAIDSTVTTLTGSQTLTNKTLTAPTLTGTAVVASLDISGDIDVDGTTNLDVVDIDGAVDMASTLTTAGDISINAGSGNPSFTIKTAGAGNNPHINYRAGDNTVFDTMLVASAATDYWRVGYGASGSVTSEFLAVTSAGNVGIGTTLPDSPLEIQAATNSSSDTTYLKLFNAGENVGHIDFENGNGSLARITGTKEGSGASANDGILTFSTALDTSLSERMRIDSSGQVGIGVSSVSSALHVAGSTGITLGAIASNTWQTTAIKAIDEGSSFKGSLAFYTHASAGSAGSATERMRIDSSGNVGIGVISPTSALDVATSSGDCIIRLGNGTSQARFAVDNDGPYIYPLTSGDTSLRVFTPTGSQALVIDSSGNVGIGTSSPDAILETSASATGNTVGALITNTNQSGTADSVSLNFGLGRTADSFIRSVEAIKVLKEQQWTGTASTVDCALVFSTTSNETTAEAMRIDSSGHAIIPAGVTLGTAVGTYNAANTLDDYEEGTWTPAVNAGSISGTSITYTGSYTKIGRQVFIHFNANSTSGDINISSYVAFSGLPFSITYVGTGTAITEDIDVFDRQGYATISGTILSISNAGSSSGTNSINVGIVGTTS